MKPNDKDIKKCTVYFSMPFSAVGLISVSFPLFGLIYCFFSSVMTQHDKINEIVCGVQNFIPSISSITGTAPQRYVWRIFIALHSAPRFVIAIVHLNYYLSRITDDMSSMSGRFHYILIYVNFVINIVENMCLISISYISSIDNYPIHEKIFIAFMITSCVYMPITLYLYRFSHGEYSKWTKHEKQSYYYKKMFFTTILICTAGLVWYILKHRLWCTPNAFSWFSACEYGIGMSNMGFNLSASMDFNNCQIYVATRSVAATENGDCQNVRLHDNGFNNNLHANHHTAQNHIKSS